MRWKSWNWMRARQPGAGRGIWAIRLESKEFDAARSQRLNSILNSFPGRDGVVLMVRQADGRKFRAELPVTVDSQNSVLKTEISRLFGRVVA